MSNVKTMPKLSKDELISLTQRGAEAKAERIGKANAKGRKLGFLGVEYATRQNSQYLRGFSSEDIAVALYEAGMATIWKDDQRGYVFAFLDDEGNVPDSCDLPHVTEVERVVSAWADKQSEAPKKTRQAK